MWVHYGISIVLLLTSWYKALSVCVIFAQEYGLRDQKAAGMWWEHYRCHLCRQHGAILQWVVHWTCHVSRIRASRLLRHLWRHRNLPVNLGKYTPPSILCVCVCVCVCVTTKGTTKKTSPQITRLTHSQETWHPILPTGATSISKKWKPCLERKIYFRLMDAARKPSTSSQVVTGRPSMRWWNSRTRYARMVTLEMVVILEMILELMKSVMQPLCLTATASWIQMIRIFCASKESCLRANKIKRKAHYVLQLWLDLYIIFMDY